MIRQTFQRKFDRTGVSTPLRSYPDNLCAARRNGDAIVLQRKRVIGLSKFLNVDAVYVAVSTAIQQRYAPPSGVSESTPAETDDFIQEVLRGERLL